MKKVISLLLSITICAGCIPALAVKNEVDFNEITELPWEEEIVGTSDLNTPILINEVVSNIEVESTQEPMEYNPIVHEEVITEDIVFPEGSENLMPVALPKPGEISLFSLDSTDSAVWNSLYSEQFGDDYLKPYAKNEDGQRVSGNTNRLVIEETDLTLPGKNGLDLVIRRKYDNQDYNYAYSYYRTDELSTTYQYRYIYGFTNTTDDTTVYIGFLTEEQMYANMYDGCYVKELDESKLVSLNNSNIKYYNFEYVSGRIDTDTSLDYFEYDNNISMQTDNQKYKEGTTNSICSRKIFNKRDYIDKDWKLLLPEAYLYGHSYTTETEEYPKTYEREYVGAFRDINGKVHTLWGDDTFKKYKDDTTTYTSSYYPDENNYLSFESLYAAIPLYENGPEYNFVVYDNTGLTYYFYNEGIKAGEKPSTTHEMYILAVKDEYGNMIRYEYSDGYGSIAKIIDTYGREVTISEITNGKQISYYDDIEGKTKNITYTTEELPASELKNDSTLKTKDVHRFIVTNEEDEETIYDSRYAGVISHYYSSSSGSLDDVLYPDTEQVKNDWGYNIERIIYPTGAETRYKYKSIYPINHNTRIRRSVYAVEASYDIVDGVNENYKKYSFTNSSMDITSTCLEEVIDRETVIEYNSDGLEKSINITPHTTSRPYKKISYTYDSYNNPKTIVTNENGTSSTNTYTYASGYPNVVTSESDGLRSTAYNYHTVNGKLTDKISKITYKKMSGTSYVDDYHISTTLTADNKSIEYEKVIQDEVIKAQKKYEYDTSGEVVAIKQWTNDTNNDGKLDENDDIVTLSNDYEITEEKSKNVFNTVANVLNADGDNEGSVVFEYFYNIYGSPVAQVDSYGTETMIRYDDLNRPIEYILPNGATRTIEYYVNKTCNYTLVTDEAGLVTKNVYDGFGRIKEKYKKIGSTYSKIEEYEYDAAGRLSSQTLYRESSKGTKETYTYDALNRVLQKSVYELPDTLLYTENYSYSNSSSGKVITKTTNATGVTAATQKSYYNVYGQLTKVESISDDVTLTTLYEYDYLDRVTKQTDPNGNETTYEYTYDGQVSKQTNAAGDYVSTVYDLAGQAVSMIDANGNTTNTVYDKLGRAIKVTTPFDDTVSGETKTYYDKNSNIVKTSTKRSQDNYQTEEYKYDNMGNLLATVTNDGTTDIVTQYQYDTANRITKMITGLSAYVTNPTGGAVTQYSYNNQGYVSQITDPMGLIETYDAYDYAGNVLTSTDKNGNVAYDTYGPFGLTESGFYSSPETKEYLYNNLGHVIATKAVNANEQTVEESYQYDAFGRLTSSVANDGSVQNYTYDSASNVTAYELIKDDVVKNSIAYAYNNLNQLTGLTNNDIITTYQYDSNGNLTQKALDNGVTTNYIYNKAGLMTYMESKKGSDVYTYSDCTYLLNGLMKKVIMPYDGDNEDESKIKNYNYDATGRLIGEHVVNAAGSPLVDLYTYDLRGNRISKTASVPDDMTTETINYQYDMNNRLMNEDSTKLYEGTLQEVRHSTRYYYDENGNMTAKQKIAYGGSNILGAVLSGRSSDTGLSIYRYDAFNRLTNYNSGSAEASYMYNVDNLRTSKTVNKATTEFVWNGQNLASETKDEVTNTYTYDITGVHIANRNGTVTSYLKDHHGNIAGRSNAAGAMLEELNGRMDYDAFGNQWIGDVPDPFGYCGEYYDSESGLIYLRNRYYDSTTGRFINEDPIKDGLNWYVYANNNPIMFIDPTGLIITASVADSKTIEEQLEKLTDDELEFEEYVDENGVGTGVGEFVIIKKYDTDKHVGQTLISDLINSSNIVNVNIGVDQNGNINSKWPANNDPNGIIQIYVDPDNTLGFGKSYTYTNGTSMREEMPEYIILGHELIHAWRELHGMFDSNVERGVLPYDYPESIYFKQMYGYDFYPAEEAKTVGGNYVNELNQTMQNYASYSGIICENGLRLENGLNIRTTYYAR